MTSHDYANGLEPHADLERYTHITYAVYAAALVMPVLCLVGVILAWVKRADARSSWLQSHYSWLIRTFFYSLGLATVAGLTLLVGVGFLLMPGVWIFWMYRVIKGWVSLRDRRPVA